MIYKIGATVWSLTDHEIKEHVIEDSRFITWIQKLKIDGEWRPADDFYPTLASAMEADERNAFGMGR